MKNFIYRFLIIATILCSVVYISSVDTINDMGVFIWNNIERVKDKDELLGLILDEYEVEKEVAKSDLDEFLGKLKQAEII